MVAFVLSSACACALAVQCACRGDRLQAAAVFTRVVTGRAGEGNVAIWGTPPDSIDDAEDRDKWYELLTRLDIRQPPGGMVTSEEGALAEAAKLGYPVRLETL